MPRRELLPDSTAKRAPASLAKAPRDRHPSAPREEQSAAPQEGSPPAVQGKATRRSAGKSAPAGPGMKRKTYYMPERLADDLEAEITRLREHVTHGRVSKAVILAEIVRAGIERSETVSARLVQRVESDW